MHTDKLGVIARALDRLELATAACVAGAPRSGIMRRPRRWQHAARLYRQTDGLPSLRTILGRDLHIIENTCAAEPLLWPLASRLRDDTMCVLASNEFYPADWPVRNWHLLNQEGTVDILKLRIAAMRAAKAAGLVLTVPVTAPKP